ncbi:hypothetical protein [Streptomyces sp. CB03911]|uniref:hypothetical protein n=1 Tax=Streptomyces sp. CB03911 TaxID=1804758 RepID=UPI00093AEE51|nr:hypothetical protein [Streptomyces sp. CB03911]OKI25554.1 hypothetical protein A6A07_30230 [Streptomyces sp. CB03911]
MMIHPDEIAEREQELAKSWASEGGLRDRFTIEMFPLLHADGDGIGGGRLIRATDDGELRKLVERFGRYLKVEERYDLPLFTADHTRDQEVYLVTSKRLTTLTPIACGAAGFRARENELSWIWLHPFERGRG